MSASDAMIEPIYNCKYREYIDLLDTDGALIALADADTELGKDSATLADATNEMSEGSTGLCSLDLTYAEMAYNCVVIVPKSTGAVTRAIKLFPKRLPILRSDTAQAGAVGSITLDAAASAKDGVYVGCYVRASNNDPAGIQGEVRKITGYTGETKVATVAPNWENTPTSSTDFEILVPSDMSLSTLLTDASGVVDEMETQMATDPTGFKVNVMEINGTSQTANDNGADINAILLDTGTNGVVLADSAISEAKIGADAITNAKIADNALAEEQFANVEGAYNPIEILRGIAAAVMNDVEDDGLSFRDVGDTKDRFTVVVDENANRNVTIQDLT